MNASDYMRREVEEITGRTGRYIPPWRLSNLMNTANKIVKLVVESDLAMTYEEIQLVLGIVQGAVGRAIGKEKE